MLTRNKKTKPIPSADNQPLVIPKISYSKYEVSPNSEFTVKFCLGFKHGRPQVFREDACFQKGGENLEPHWATFRMWTYTEELDWHNRTLHYQDASHSFITNQDKLNELKIRHLLKSWSFEKFDPKFKLLHVNGILSDESYNLLKGFYPAIVNNLIYLMNQVLEQNG